jgi:hypothetical protein
MIEGSDIKILLTHRYKTFEGVKKELLHGYVTYKGSPVMSVTGSRVKDKEATTREGEAYSYSQYVLKFGGSEDRKNQFPGEALFLRGGLKRFNGSKLATTFFLTEKDGGTPEFASGFKSSLFDPLVLPLSGIAAPTTVVNGFGDEVTTIKLELDEGMYSKDKSRTKYKLVDMKGTFPEGDLAAMKEKQFQFFDKFAELFAEKESTAPAY